VRDKEVVQFVAYTLYTACCSTSLQQIDLVDLGLMQKTAWRIAEPPRPTWSQSLGRCSGNREILSN